jgi:nucleoside-diphosphate-sugar epimerase
MKILVTGSSGGIGKATVQRLIAEGHETVLFDIQKGDDLRSFEQVKAAVQGCDAIVHAGAIPGDIEGRELEVIESNAQGTWNILFAAQQAGIRRVVHFSSIQALGYVGNHHAPLYFPVDDAYPRHPMTPYQLGKHLGEETCKTFANRWGMEIVSLRPMAVIHEEHYKDWLQSNVEEDVKSVLWAYTDLAEVVEAVYLGLTKPVTGFHAFLISAEDTMLDCPTMEAIERTWADIPHRIPLEEWFRDNPYRTLVDCSDIKRVLGWEHKRSWRDFV